MNDKYKLRELRDGSMFQFEGSDEVYVVWFTFRDHIIFERLATGMVTIWDRNIDFLDCYRIADFY